MQIFLQAFVPPADYDFCHCKHVPFRRDSAVHHCAANMGIIPELARWKGRLLDNGTFGAYNNVGILWLQPALPNDPRRAARRPRRPAIEADAVKDGLRRDAGETRSGRASKRFSR